MSGNSLFDAATFARMVRHRASTLRLTGREAAKVEMWERRGGIEGAGNYEANQLADARDKASRNSQIASRIEDFLNSDPIADAFAKGFAMALGYEGEAELSENRAQALAAAYAVSGLQ